MKLVIACSQLAQLENEFKSLYFQNPGSHTFTNVVFAATDPDAGDTVSYNIESGYGSNLFLIDAANGNTFKTTQTITMQNLLSYSFLINVRQVPT